MELINEYLDYWQEKYPSILEYLLEHIVISFTVMIFAIVFSIPLAIYMTKLKSEKIKSVIFNIANIFQTIPTIALLAIMIPILGIGFKPAVVALFLYSLLPHMLVWNQLIQKSWKQQREWVSVFFSNYLKLNYLLRCLM